MRGKLGFNIGLILEYQKAYVTGWGTICITKGASLSTPQGAYTD